MPCRILSTRIVFYGMLIHSTKGIMVSIIPPYLITSTERVCYAKLVNKRSVKCADNRVAYGKAGFNYFNVYTACP